MQNEIIKVLRKNGDIFFIILFLYVAISIGSAMNTKAMLDNGGKMPVLTPYSVTDSEHFAYTNPDTINSAFYSDIYPFHLFGKDWVASRGDFIIWISTGLIVFVLIFMLIRKA